VGTLASDTVHKAVTGLMAAMLIGSFKFYVDTQTELALLKRDMESLEATADAILRIVEAAHPRTR